MSDVITLKELARITMGQSPPGSSCNSVGNGDPLLNGPTEFGFSHPAPVQFTTDGNRFCEEGDVLFCVRGSTTGRMNLADQRYALGRGLAAFSHRGGKALNGFLLHLINHNLKALLNNTNGSTFPNLTGDLLASFKMSVPPRPEQKKIAAVLSALDAKIELNNRINAELEAMAKTLYDYWFVQFDFPDAKGRPYKSSGGKMIYNETLKRDIPEGWSVKNLGSLFTSNRGVSYSSANTGSEGTPMVNLASYNVDGSYNPDGIKFFSGVAVKGKKLAPFSLVMCNTQQTAIDFSKDIIGKAFLVPDIFDGDIVSSHHVTHIRVSDEPLKFYLHRLFNTDHFHKYVAGYCSGTNILGLIFSGVENYEAEIPPDGLLEKFVSFMKPIEKRKSIVIKETQQLTELRDWLLPMLMNGQVQVV